MCHNVIFLILVSFCSVSSLLQERVVGAEGGVFGTPEAVYGQPEEEYL